MRDKFNEEGGPGRLLYLISRCVGNAVRFNLSGEFNQSPEGTREEIEKAHESLKGKTTVTRGDYRDILSEGTQRISSTWTHFTSGRDNPRYFQSLDYGPFVENSRRGG